jgi:hypothetical protein
VHHGARIPSAGGAEYSSLSVIVSVRAFAAEPKRRLDGRLSLGRAVPMAEHEL